MHGDQLSRSTDINIGPSAPLNFVVAETGQALPHYRFAAGPFTNFARIISFQSSAVSTYNGLTHRGAPALQRRLQARVAYTLGKVTDTVPDATAVVPGTDDAKFASNPADFDADRAPGNNDQRHRAGAERRVYDATRSAAALAGGWTFAAIITAQSGQPYSAYVSNDINNDQNARNDIAPGTTRNQYRLPSQVIVRPARRARHLRRQGQGAADLGSVQPVQPRQHQRRAQHALQRVGDDADDADQFPAAHGVERPRIMQLAVKLRF